MIIEISKGQQITLPASIRKKYGWKPGTKINLEDTKDGVKLESVEPQESWKEIWKEADKYPCKLTPKELKELIHEEIFRR